MMATHDDTLHELYRSRPAARELFDSILTAGVDEGRTTVDELTGSGKVSRRQAITLLRGLDEAGCGEFKVGRKGHPSRLEWSFDPRDVVERVVNGGPEDVVNGGPEDVVNDGPEGVVNGSAEDVELDPPILVATQAALDLDSPVNGSSSPSGSSDSDPTPAPVQMRRVRRPSSNTGAKTKVKTKKGDQMAADSIEHVYVLRPGARVEVTLPADLTPREAAVLADWLRNLSFNRD